MGYGQDCSQSYYLPYQGECLIIFEIVSGPYVATSSLAWLSAYSPSVGRRGYANTKKHGLADVNTRIDE